MHSVAAVSSADDLPFYRPTGSERELFEHAYRNQLPLLLKGPTGCGKTRFVAHMAARLGRPLYTVSCHDDLTAADLTGRYLLKGGDTVWVDGPLTRAVREGAICYLDEVVEARKDVTVVLHPVTDDRRMLPLERTGERVEAPPEFMLVVSYNPGYHNVLKTLKPSTRQRFVAIEFDYPRRELEADIIAHESGVALELALELARIGEKVRNLRDHGLDEGVSTRLLIYAGQLMTQGIPAHRACQLAITKAITDDLEAQRAVHEIISTILP